jgi:hypothetical protein
MKMCDWKEDKEYPDPPRGISMFREGLHMKCYECGKTAYLSIKEHGKYLTCDRKGVTLPPYGV